MPLPRFVPLLLLLACLFGACATHKKDPNKPKATPAKKSIADMSNDVNFQAFIGRLRIAVRKRDRNMLASMMAPDFGWRWDKPAEGENPFDYWDKTNAWPELERVVNERFAPSESFMVAPPVFVTDQNYRGYRAGIRQVNGSWRFAYFVTGEDVLQ